MPAKVPAKKTKRGSDAKSASHIDKYIGQRIKAARMMKKYSQTDLGTALEVSFQQVQKYERGVNRITVTRLLEIGKALGIEHQFFLDGLPEAGPIKIKRGSTRPPPKHLDHTAANDFLATKQGIAVLETFPYIKNEKARDSLIELMKTLKNGNGC